MPQLFLLKWVRLLFGREFHVDDLLIIWDALARARERLAHRSPRFTAT